MAQIFGLEMRGKFEDFYKFAIPEKLTHQLNGIRPIDHSRIDSWKKHPERVRQQFTECPALHDLVIKYGYEKDTSWLKNL